MAALEAFCSAGDRLITGKAPNRVAVAAIKATDVVTWDGIEDRTLFALNVRRDCAATGLVASWTERLRANTITLTFSRTTTVSLWSVSISTRTRMA